MTEKWEKLSIVPWRFLFDALALLRPPADEETALDVFASLVLR